MIYRIVMNGEGHKMAFPIKNREELMALRNSPENLSLLADFRNGNEKAKGSLLQLAYNLGRVNGLLAGCKSIGSYFFHDVDCYDREHSEETKALILSKKDAIGLKGLERSASGGWHLFCQRVPGTTILENQVRVATILRLEMDTGAKDLQRVVFSTSGSEEDLPYLDDCLFEEPMSAEECEAEYQRLKERERLRKEDVPKGAKKANKHYRPWEDEGGTQGDPQGAPSVAQSPGGAEGRSGAFPDNYHGFTFEEILRKYWEVNNNGYEPTQGDRDTLTYQLARDLRHICGRNADWLDQVIPCYDGFTLEEKRQKIRSALQSTYEGMPRTLQAVLDALEAEQEKGLLQSLSATGATADDGEAQTPQFTVNTRQLPIGLRESLKGNPPQLYLPLLVGEMPVLMAMASDVTVRYCDGRIHTLGGMAIIKAEQASNKSAIEAVVDLWLEPVRKEDELARQREDAVSKKNKGRKANERAEPEPQELVREVPITISCSRLLKRLKLAKGKTLYSFCAEMDTLVKSNSAGNWSAKYDIYRVAFDRGRWGQDYNSDQAESGMVKVAYNWTILSTPGSLKKCFRGDNVENGLSSRMMLAELPDDPYAEMTVFAQPSEADVSRIEQAVAILRSASGFYDTPRLRRAVAAWVEQKRQEAALSLDRVKAVYRKRAAVIGFRCGVVFMLLCGKESKACIDFALLMCEYTLQMQVRNFGPTLMNQYEKAHSEPVRFAPNRVIFDELPSTFVLADLKAMKGADCKENALYAIIHRWVKEGWVEKRDKTYAKIWKQA